MMNQKQTNNKLILFLYRAGLFWLNLYLFVRMASYAMGFARTWTNAYQSFASHLLILLYAVGFFLVFRNLSLLALSLDKNDPKSLTASFKKIALISVFILLILLFVQVLPEFLLSASVSY